MGRSVVKLKKIASGVYATEDERFQVEFQPDITDCEHPQCDTLHKKFHIQSGRYGWSHLIEVPCWHVWDNEKDDYASDAARDFATKREAVGWLADHLKRAGRR